MKEYMLVYVGGDPDWTQNTSQQEMAATMERWGSWMEEIAQKEQLVTGGSPLHFGGKRMKDGVTTDIAAAEYKELVSGYSIISAKDIDEAVSIAKSCPIFDKPGITVEVREVMQLG